VESSRHWRGANWNAISTCCSTSAAPPCVGSPASDRSPRRYWWSRSAHRSGLLDGVEPARLRCHPVGLAGHRVGVDSALVRTVGSTAWSTSRQRRSATRCGRRALAFIDARSATAISGATADAHMSDTLAIELSDGCETTRSNASAASSPRRCYGRVGGPRRGCYG
jgi:hypothetical protein